jgi:hypothetical protein
MGRLKGTLILGIVLFCVLLGIYVSIPDYPRSAYPWEIMLWGESSQWWSEVSWIMAFCIFSVSLVFIFDWSSGLRNLRVESYQRVARIIFLVAFLSLVWNFSAVYFSWSGLEGTVILDRGGYLHGVFYLGVALQGLWLFEESIGLVSKVMPRVSAKSQKEY